MWDAEKAGAWIGYESISIQYALFNRAWVRSREVRATVQGTATATTTATAMQYAQKGIDGGEILMGGRRRRLMVSWRVRMSLPRHRLSQGTKINDMGGYWT
jgi:hypothetical protein